MTPLPLNALRVFDAVARCGSFRLAAEELCVSQSAVSHQIKHLEGWFGRPLFDRSGNRPKLLPTAVTLATELNAAFNDIATACQRVRGDAAALSLVIAAIPSVAVCWLIPRLSEFRDRHPGVDIRVIYAIHGQDIDFSQVDLAFVFGKNTPALPGTQAYWLASGSSVPVGSPALGQSLDKTNVEQALLSAGLLHDSNTDGWNTWFEQSGVCLPAKLTGPVFEDFNLLRAAVLSGQGVALCPLDIINTDISDHLLVPLSTQAIHEDSNYYLVARDTPDTEKSGVVESFRQWVFENRDNESTPT